MHNSALNNCLAVFAEGDAIIFIGDGAYALATNHDALQAHASKGAVFALLDDALARGLNNPTLQDCQMLNHAGFVALTCQHNPLQSWY